MANRTRRFDVEIGSEQKGSGFKDAASEADKLGQKLKATAKDADRVGTDMKAAGAKAKGAFSGVGSEAAGLGAKLRGARQDASGAFRGIEGDAKGLGSKLGTSGREAGQKLGDGIKQGAEGALDDFGSDVRETLGALGGITAGVGFAAAFTEGLDRGASADAMSASLGLSEDQSRVAGDVAGSLYADAYGNSMQDVHTAIDAVGSTLTSVTQGNAGDLERLAAKAMDVSTVFGTDVTATVGLAGQAIQHGLARDADHAFDLITASMQRMPAGMREELFPAIEEYGSFLHNLGFTGEEAFGLLAAASHDGTFAIDKTADALKELTIRGTDMSATSVAAFQAAGLSADDMASQLLAGGDTARGAFDQIVAGLLSIEDPTLQANSAIALFGAPLEDLSTAEIPQFLQTLQNASGGLGDVSGAAERAGQVVNDNLKTKLTGVQREGLAPLLSLTELVASGFLALPGPVKAFIGGLGGVLAVAVPVVWAGKQVAGAWESTMEVLANLTGRIAAPASAVEGAFNNAGNSAAGMSGKLGGVASAASVAAGALGVAGLIGTLVAVGKAQEGVRIDADGLSAALSGTSSEAQTQAARFFEITTQFGHWEDVVDRIVSEQPALASQLLQQADAFNLSADQVNVLRNAVEQNTAAEANAQIASDEHTAAVDRGRNAMEGQAGATGDAIAQLQQYADTLRAQFDPMFGMMDALRANHEATVGVLDAQAAYNDAVAAHGPRSNEARSAQVALTQAQQSAASSALDVTGATASLNAAIAENPSLLNQSKGQLMVWASQGLITEDTAADMARQFDATALEAINLGRTDPNVRVSSAGTGTTSSRLNGVEDAANRIPSKKVIEVEARFRGAMSFLTGSIFGGKRAKGGPVDPGRLYEVAEQGRAELLEMGGRSYLIPGASGSVVPADDMATNGLNPFGGGGDVAAAIAQASNRQIAADTLHFHWLRGQLGSDLRWLEPINQGVWIGAKRLVFTTRAQLGHSFGGDMRRALGYWLSRVPDFDAGGIVPGPVGMPRLVRAHGGEEIVPAHERGGGDTYVTVAVDARGAVGLDETKLEEVVTRAWNRSVQNGRPVRRPPGWR